MENCIFFSLSFYVVAGFGKWSEIENMRDRNFQETFQTCNSSTIRIKVKFIDSHSCAALHQK